MSVEPIEIGPYRCGDGCPLLLIAGPCVLQSPEDAMAIARELRAATANLPVNLVFKGSFDKANRTSIQSFRGPGIERGLEILRQVRDEQGIPVTTDIHEPWQASRVGEVCEIVQIPAFLSRQTDLLVAAASTGRAVHVKKGQFMAPSDMSPVVNKLQSSGCRKILLCERGTFFGYGQLVNDLQSLPRMRDLKVPVVFDATHSVQEPGGLGHATGGNRAMVEPLARAAVAVGVDGLFFETHPDPDSSPSDGANMVSLEAFPAMVKRLLRLRAVAEEFSREASPPG